MLIINGIDYHAPKLQTPLHVGDFVTINSEAEPRRELEIVGAWTIPHSGEPCGHQQIFVLMGPGLGEYINDQDGAARMFSRRAIEPTGKHIDRQISPLVGRDPKATGSAGGHAAAASMSAEQRRNRALKAVQARETKRKLNR